MSARGRPSNPSDAGEPAGDAPPPTTVAGERTMHSVARVSSMQSRIGNFLALGLVCALGLGALTWYYAHALTWQSRGNDSVRLAAAKRAEGDVPLPSLGRIDLPASSAALPPVEATAWTGGIGAGGSPEPTRPPGGIPLMEVPLAPSGGASAAPAAPLAKGAPPTMEERELSGGVFASHGPETSSVVPDADLPHSTRLTDRADRSNEAQSFPGRDLSAWLRPDVSPAARATLLPAQRLLLPKGAFIDCTLETAIDSTLPGMTTCVTATDTFGVDGQVVLLERGTKLVGETRGEVQQGTSRLFVLWTEARTPTGVVVPLDSPGTDALGRAGLSGDVNRHFWQRFGAAMLVSVINGVVQAAVESRSNGGTVVVNPSSSQDVLTEIFKSTVNIPPTVAKRNGDRIEVMVARDIDFRSVYELRSFPPR